tara:strand:+ start:5119 stop:5769 length:651 start_codon:yes stop_codon:yes gene_type:complete
MRKPTTTLWVGSYNQSGPYGNDYGQTFFTIRNMTKMVTLDELARLNKRKQEKESRSESVEEVSTYIEKLERLYGSGHLLFFHNQWSSKLDFTMRWQHYDDFDYCGHKIESLDDFSSMISATKFLTSITRKMAKKMDRYYGPKDSYQWTLSDPYIVYNYLRASGVSSIVYSESLGFWILDCSEHVFRSRNNYDHPMQMPNVYPKGKPIKKDGKTPNL